MGTSCEGHGYDGPRASLALTHEINHGDDPFVSFVTFVTFVAGAFRFFLLGALAPWRLGVLAANYEASLGVLAASY